MNEPPGARMRVGLSALTVAEYFREDLQQDVLLFIDNIFRLDAPTSQAVVIGVVHRRRRRGTYLLIWDTTFIRWVASTTDR